MKDALGIGTGYTKYRRPDLRISAAILDALGGARTVAALDDRERGDLP